MQQLITDEDDTEADAADEGGTIDWRRILDGGKERQMAGSSRYYMDECRVSMSLAAEVCKELADRVAGWEEALGEIRHVKGVGRQLKREVEGVHEELIAARNEKTVLLMNARDEARKELQGEQQAWECEKENRCKCLLGRAMRWGRRTRSRTSSEQSGGRSI